jgi:hypothetical protein
LDANKNGQDELVLFLSLAHRRTFIREGVSGIVSSATDGKHGALPLTLRQRGYDGARIEYVNAANQNATKCATDVNQANRETGDRMASVSMQQGREAAGAAYAADRHCNWWT